MNPCGTYDAITINKLHFGPLKVQTDQFFSFR